MGGALPGHHRQDRVPRFFMSGRYISLRFESEAAAAVGVSFL